MDDKKIKEIFNNYNPILSPGSQFIERVKLNLEAVEIIKAQNVAVRKCCRRAIVAAAVAGFIVGVIFSIAMPYIAEAVVSLMEALPRNAFTAAISDNYGLVVWPLICATSLFIALNTYEITLSSQKHRIG